VAVAYRISYTKDGVRHIVYALAASAAQAARVGAEQIEKEGGSLDTYRVEGGYFTPLARVM
jgi:hypothetical protein